MPKLKRLSLISGIVLLCVAATAVFAYTELWTGGCSTGTLYYNNVAYTYGTGSYTGYIRDTTLTAGQKDTFDKYTNTIRCAFYHRGIDGSIQDSLVIKYYSWGFKGWKYTGTSGTKSGQGTFHAACSNKVFLFTGTWNASTPTYGFDYTQTPPTASGSWSIDANQPYYGSGTITGSGTFSLTRTSYTP